MKAGFKTGTARQNHLILILSKHKDLSFPKSNKLNHLPRKLWRPHFDVAKCWCLVVSLILLSLLGCTVEETFRKGYRTEVQQNVENTASTRDALITQSNIKPVDFCLLDFKSSIRTCLGVVVWAARLFQCDNWLNSRPLVFSIGIASAWQCTIRRKSS